MGPQGHSPSPDTPSASTATRTSAQEKEAAARDMRLAILNALKLGLSLVGTFMVFVAVRLMMPRYIDAETYGKLNFADAYAISFFVFTTFGVDSYIRKEVSTRLEHANDFWAGFWLLRLVAAAIITGLMVVGLIWMHKGALEWRLAFIFAAGQVAFVHNYTVQSLLQAASEVNELAWMNVISKLLWGGGIYLSLYLGWPLETIALWFLVSEAAKAIVLSNVCQKKLNLRWNVDMRATKLVLIASFPYFLNYMSTRTYEKLNAIMLSAMINDLEVGWYSAAANISAICLLFLPVVQAVIIPLASRTGTKSVEAMNEIMRGAVRLIVVCATLISLILMLHAEFFVVLTSGKDYSPAAPSLLMLAPQFPLTYLATFGALHLILLNRVYTVIKINLAALIISPILNAPLIMLGQHWGPGWAGGLAAFASICTEGANAAISFYILGAAAVDRRFWVIMGKTAAICALVTGLHVLLPSWQAWRIPLEVALYLLLAVLSNALPVGDIRRMAMEAVNSRRGKKAT